ncbi:MAG: DUF1292 domain-containing protein [Bacilli bacterium]|nr:DUF1292 domain-containing protein [Bacilli bacterium]
MEENRKIVIQNSDGTAMEVELITYLISDDKLRSYLVYSKGEKNIPGDDEVIYITKFVNDNNVYKVFGIENDDEWSEVQKLLKAIANA